MSLTTPPNEKGFVLNSEQKLEISTKLLKGVVTRASVLFLLFGSASIFYGIQTFPIFAKFNNSLDIWDNVWPRLLFATLPSFLIIAINEKTSLSLKTKALIWAIGYPLIYLGACLTYVWPAIYSGNSEIYLFFHAANMFCICLSFFLVAPSIGWSLFHLFCFSISFFAPVIFLLKDNSILRNLFLNDSLSSIAIAVTCSYFMYSLRKKVATFEAQIRGMVTPFLGEKVTTALYDNKMEKLADKTVKGFILNLDIRGFTSFKQKTDSDISSAFMREYQTLVSKNTGKFGGFLHKSNGDGHMISIGIMDDIDISDLPNMEHELKSAEFRKNKNEYENSVKMVASIVAGFEELLEKYLVEETIKIGASIVYGTIDIKLQGDGVHRSELDIEGEALIRGARLEAYTKVILSTLKSDDSLLVLDEELVRNFGNIFAFKSWSIDRPERQVRDYSNIKSLYYQSWPHRLRKKQRRAA